MACIIENTGHVYKVEGKGVVRVLKSWQSVDENPHLASFEEDTLGNKNKDEQGRVRLLLALLGDWPSVTVMVSPDRRFAVGSRTPFGVFWVYEQLT